MLVVPRALLDEIGAFEGIRTVGFRPADGVPGRAQTVTLALRLQLILLYFNDLLRSTRKFVKIL